MRGKTDRARAGAGPLGEEELAGLFERGWSPLTRRALAVQWGVRSATPAEQLCDELCARLDDEALVRERLASVARPARAVLGHVARGGGRVRGENLRKELLLKGFGDATLPLRALIMDGLLMPVPGNSVAELDVEGSLQEDAFLQHDLCIVGEALCAACADEEALAEGDHAAWDGEVVSTHGESVAALELNLLQLTHDLQNSPLRLNKSGAPNRRSLGKFTPALTRPGDAGGAPDTSVPADMDHVSLLLALAEELGFLVREDASLRAAHEPREEYFCSPPAARHRRLMTALRDTRFWSELLSARLQSGRDADALIDEQLSVTHPNGAPLIGARGYLVSVLRRANLRGWTPLESIVALCVQLDRDYLPRVLARAASSDVSPRDYVEAFILRALAWTGIIERGEGADGVALVRFTDEGARMIGMKDAPTVDEPDEPVKCMIVQPNYEAMVFLDHAPMRTLFRMYQVGQRHTLADRMASFRLTPESVQRGYSLGLDAERTLEFLRAHSHIPVDDSIAFQLRDWERVWHRFTIHANGALVRHDDADRLDMIVDQLRHEWRDRDVSILRVTHGAAFIQGADAELLGKLVERERGLLFDYLGDIPPSLRFVDALEVQVDPIACDLLTWRTLQQIGELDTARSTRRARIFRLDLEHIQTRWPEDPLGEVVHFLEARTIGGLPPEQALKLRGFLGAAPRVRIMPEVVALRFQSQEDADLFAQIPTMQDAIIERASAHTFILRASARAELDGLLERVSARLIG